MKPIQRKLIVSGIASCFVLSSVFAVEATAQTTIPELSEIPIQQHQLALFIQRFQADLASTEHTFDINAGHQREAALRRLYKGWLARLSEFNYSKLALEDQVDYALLKRELNYRLSQLDFERKRTEQALQLLPGIAPLIELAEQRRALLPLKPEQAKQRIIDATNALQKYQNTLTKQTSTSPIVALRAAKLLQGFRDELKDWHTFYNGYDPAYTKSISKPYEALDKQLDSYGQFLRNDLAGAKNPETIIGDPIGRDALEAALRYDMIPYTPEQIVQLAERELAWCQTEMNKAAANMGFSDWQQALEKLSKMAQPSASNRNTPNNWPKRQWPLLNNANW